MHSKFQTRWLICIVFNWNTIVHADTRTESRSMITMLKAAISIPVTMGTEFDFF